MIVPKRRTSKSRRNKRRSHDALSVPSRAVCPTCGAAVLKTFRFCGQCGQALADAFRPSPQGSVTIMFTDIEGFTSVLASLTGEEAHQLVDVHQRIVRECVQAHGGFEVKALGDGFMLVFTDAGEAVRCAVAIQQALADHNRHHPERALLVRIGINSGDTFRHQKDYFGLAVSMAARVMEKVGMKYEGTFYHADFEGNWAHRHRYTIHDHEYMLEKVDPNCSTNC